MKRLPGNMLPEAAPRSKRAPKKPKRELSFYVRKRLESVHRLDVKISMVWEPDDPTGPERAGALLAAIFRTALPPEKCEAALAELERAVKEAFE